MEEEEIQQAIDFYLRLAKLKFVLRKVGMMNTGIQGEEEKVMLNIRMVHAYLL